MRRLILVLAWLGLLGTGLDTVVLGLEVPFLSQRVTDLAEILDVDAELVLEQQLKSLEAETGAQVAVLTVPSLDGEVLEDYSLRVVETWQLGRQGVDDGVLVLVARDDRKVRIEVGYGLEGAITDLQSRRIIDGLMVPSFRDGDYAAGIEAAIGAIGGAVRGESDAIPEASSSSSSSGDDWIPIFVFLALVGRGALLSPGRGGWVLWFVLIPIVFFAGLAAFGLPVAIGLAAVWAVLGALLRQFMPASWRQASSSRARRRGGWTHYGGSWGSGGGGGFGGFSGGGGSFGGGGASGSW